MAAGKTMTCAFVAICCILIFAVRVSAQSHEVSHGTLRIKWSSGKRDFPCQRPAFRTSFKEKANPLYLLPRFESSQLCQASDATLFNDKIKLSGVFIPREGKCSLAKTVESAAAAGAGAVFIINDVDETIAMMSDSKDDSLHIPTCMLSKSDGAEAQRLHENHKRATLQLYSAGSIKLYSPINSSVTATPGSSHPVTFQVNAHVKRVKIALARGIPSEVVWSKAVYIKNLNGKHIDDVSYATAIQPDDENAKEKVYTVNAMFPLDAPGDGFYMYVVQNVGDNIGSVVSQNRVSLVPGPDKANLGFQFLIPQSSLYTIIAGMTVTIRWTTSPDVASIPQVQLYLAMAEQNKNGYFDYIGETDPADSGPVIIDNTNTFQWTPHISLASQRRQYLFRIRGGTDDTRVVHANAPYRFIVERCRLSDFEYDYTTPEGKVYSGYQNGVDEYGGNAVVRIGGTIALSWKQLGQVSQLHVLFAAKGVDMKVGIPADANGKYSIKLSKESGFVEGLSYFLQVTEAGDHCQSDSKRFTLAPRLLSVLWNPPSLLKSKIETIVIKYRLLGDWNSVPKGTRIQMYMQRYTTFGNNKVGSPVRIASVDLQLNQDHSIRRAMKIAVPCFQQSDGKRFKFEFRYKGDYHPVLSSSFQLDYKGCVDTPTAKPTVAPTRGDFCLSWNKDTVGEPMLRNFRLTSKVDVDGTNLRVNASAAFSFTTLLDYKSENVAAFFVMKSPSGDCAWPIKRSASLGQVFRYGADAPPQDTQWRDIRCLNYKIIGDALSDHSISTKIELYTCERIPCGVAYLFSDILALSRACTLKASGSISTGRENRIYGNITMIVGSARREIELDVIDNSNTTLQGKIVVNIDFRKAEIRGPTICDDPPSEGTFAACVKANIPRVIVAGYPTVFAVLIERYFNLTTFPYAEWGMSGYCVAHPLEKPKELIGNGRKFIISPYQDNTSLVGVFTIDVKAAMDACTYELCQVKCAVKVSLGSRASFRRRSLETYDPLEEYFFEFPLRPPNEEEQVGLEIPESEPGNTGTIIAIAASFSLFLIGGTFFYINRRQCGCGKVNDAEVDEAGGTPRRPSFSFRRLFSGRSTSELLHEVPRSATVPVAGTSSSAANPSVDASAPRDPAGVEHNIRAHSAQPIGAGPLDYSSSDESRTRPTWSSSAGNSRGRLPTIPSNRPVDSIPLDIVSSQDIMEQPFIGRTGYVSGDERVRPNFQTTIGYESDRTAYETDDDRDALVLSNTVQSSDSTVSSNIIHNSKIMDATPDQSIEIINLAPHAEDPNEGFGERDIGWNKTTQFSAVLQSLEDTLASDADVEVIKLDAVEENHTGYASSSGDEFETLPIRPPSADNVGNAAHSTGNLVNEHTSAANAAFSLSGTSNDHEDAVPFTLSDAEPPAAAPWTTKTNPDLSSAVTFTRENHGSTINSVYLTAEAELFSDNDGKGNGNGQSATPSDSQSSDANQSMQDLNSPQRATNCDTGLSPEAMPFEPVAPGVTSVAVATRKVESDPGSLMTNSQACATDSSVYTSDTVATTEAESTAHSTKLSSYQTSSHAGEKKTVCIDADVCSDDIDADMANSQACATDSSVYTSETAATSNFDSLTGASKTEKSIFAARGAKVEAVVQSPSYGNLTCDDEETASVHDIMSDADILSDFAPVPVNECGDAVYASADERASWLRVRMNKLATKRATKNQVALRDVYEHDSASSSGEDVTTEVELECFSESNSISGENLEHDQCLGPAWD